MSGMIPNESLGECVVLYLVLCCYEYGTELWSIIKCVEFLDYELQLMSRDLPQT